MVAAPSARSPSLVVKLFEVAAAFVRCAIGSP
jgi:hypothetical protein